jgi:hypothetical protein
MLFNSYPFIFLFLFLPIVLAGYFLLGKAGNLERFPAKWRPVRVKKTRQNKNPEPRFDSIEAEKALARDQQWPLRKPSSPSFRAGGPGRGEGRAGGREPLCCSRSDAAR